MFSLENQHVVLSGIATVRVCLIKVYMGERKLGNGNMVEWWQKAVAYMLCDSEIT